MFRVEIKKVHQHSVHLTLSISHYSINVHQQEIPMSWNTLFI